MFGDFADMARRMLAVLPWNWFSDAPPVLGAVLNGLGTGMTAAFTLIQAVIQQSRLLTATGSFLDAAGCDFFGSSVTRLTGEPDTGFRQRLIDEMLRTRGTREAVNVALTELTGRAPSIFEPARSSDTGGYCVGGVGYCAAGGWGSLGLPFQFFVTMFRPLPGGIGFLAGYGSGGQLAYGSLAQEQDTLSDAQLIDSIPPLLPVGTIAWCRLSD
jgi:hypothetical protein